MYLIYKFPSIAELHPNANLKLISSKDILNLYNQDMEDFKQLEVNHIVMKWFVTQAINTHQWTEVRIRGRSCLLYFQN